MIRDKDCPEMRPGCKLLSGGEDLIDKYFVSWIDADRETIGIFHLGGKPMLRKNGEDLVLSKAASRHEKQPEVVEIDVPGMKFVPAH